MQVPMLRPVTAYSMGLICWWARLASHAPRLVNAFTHASFTSRAFKRLGGIAQEREVPPFASQTFKDWFRLSGRRPAREGSNQQVILWPDTFNNHFHPATAIAAVRVLEAAGYSVVLPKRPLCCGRPLYDWGMLNLAKHMLREILDDLRPQIRAGTLIVGLEPSCVSVFRDELPNLFPHDEDARRLSGQTLMLSEFLEREGYQPPKLAGKAIVHGHCHHKAVVTMKAEEAVLDRLGLEWQLLDSGCCGIAGAFRFERGEHYRVSIKAGERVLLPAVRNALESTLIIADGFSCREQIAQTTGRKALHLSQVVAMALGSAVGAPGGQ